MSSLVDASSSSLRDRHSYAALPRHSLIVCAALVQNPANLGSLCRTVEAFRLESLVLADKAIVQNNAFRNVAVSAHLWQPLLSCAIESLPEWFAQQQQRGYEVIGLSVSSAAASLPQFAFPQRSVLVLGQELTGIPPKILQQCDRTVSIPQFGMVESLNVQTAAAIAVYEYVRQWSLKPARDRD
jgi:tRNA guanosine-2'-O-methyltransferase